MFYQRLSKDTHQPLLSQQPYFLTKLTPIPHHGGCGKDSSYRQPVNQNKPSINDSVTGSTQDIFYTDDGMQWYAPPQSTFTFNKHKAPLNILQCQKQISTNRNNKYPTPQSRQFMSKSPSTKPTSQQNATHPNARC